MIDALVAGTLFGAVVERTAPNVDGLAGKDTEE